MNFTAETVGALQAKLLIDLRHILPECILISTMLLVLCLRVLGLSARKNLLALAWLGSFIAFVAWLTALPDAFLGSAFAGQLAFDTVTHNFRGLVLFTLLLGLFLANLKQTTDAEDSSDFVVIYLGLVLGLLFMLSANHLLSIVIAVEMASLPGYALAGFVKSDRRATEASSKYLVFGAAAAAIMIYGASWLTVAYGTGDLSRLLVAVQADALAGRLPLPALAGAAAFFVGLLFKLGAVPFHVWLPDVIEAARPEAVVLFAIASKIAATGLLLKVISLIFASASEAASTMLTIALALASMLTMSLGNLAAYRQSNLYRLLAYSSIAHAGYLLAGLAATNTNMGSALGLYAAAYLLGNFGAFAGAALLRQSDRPDTETTNALCGLRERAPLVAVAMAVFIASLLGLPPFGGFVGKFVVFQEIYRTAQATETAERGWLFALFGVALVNTVVSAGYYLRLIKWMFLDAAPTDTAMPTEPIARAAVGLLLALAAGLGFLGLFWGV